MTMPTTRDAPRRSISSNRLTAERMTDRGELRGFLSSDRIANAYLLGDLDPAYDEFCNWYGARRPNGDLDSLMVHYEGLSLPPVLAVGSRPGVAAILDRFGESLPDRFHFHVHENHIPALEERFGIAELRTMRRLSMHRAAYQPRDPDPRVRGLGHEDTAAIMELYEYYPDNLFEPHQLETGLYFGIDADDGGLASIAGVHVVSQAHDIAAIGNLVTRPDERGRGLATACTAKLLEELFERVSLVTLNVPLHNKRASRVYNRFGFRSHMTFHEGRVEETDGDEDAPND